MANKIQIIVETVDKAGRGLGNIAASVGKIGLAAGAAAAAGVAALGAGIVKLAADAEPIPGIRDAFNALTADMEGGSAAMLKALQESSSGFVSNTDLMTSFNKAAQLVSQDFAESLPGAMEAVGKVAASTGQDVGFLLDSLVTGVGRLSPMILDNLGIQVDLNQAYEDYAASIGKSADELSKQEQQTALMNQVMTKLEENTAGMASPSGGMAQLKTAMTNLKDEIGVQLIPVITPFVGKLTELAQDVLPVAAAWLGENVPKAVEFLTAAFETVWKFLSDYVIPYFQNFVIPTAQVLIPAALEVMRHWWQDVLLPAITAVWEWMSTTLIPFLQNVVFPWLQDNIPAALETLRGFWEDVLLPAITAVWDFLTERMMPIWEAIGEFLGVAIPLVLTALQGIWENVLLPAMTKVWEFVKEKLGPVFEWLKTYVIDPVRGSFDGLANIIQSVAGWIGDLTDKLRNIELPDWMTPGSPTPWEIGLRGVADAMGTLSRVQLPGLTAQLNATGTMGAPGMALAGAGGSMSNTTINIDARGAGAGVAGDIEQMIRRVLRDEGRSADARIRTRL